MNAAKRIFIPRPSVLIALLILPISLTLYLLVTQYSNKFIVEQNVGYFDIQNSFVRALIYDNKVSAFFLRFSDFAFWGVLAAVVLLLAWFVSVARTTAQNHGAVESFENFQTERSNWHKHFVVTVVLKVLLVGLCGYLIVLLAGKLIPELALAIAGVITEGFGGTVSSVALAGLYIYLAEVGIAASIKTFSHIEVN